MIALPKISGPRRPAAWTALCFAAGVLLARYLHPPIPLLFAFTALLFFAALALRRFSLASAILFPLLFCCLGGLRL